MIKGIAASPGIAIGEIFIKKEDEAVIEKTKIKDAEKEIKKLEEAVKQSKTELREIYEKTLKNIGKEEAKIFEAHQLILEDPELLGKTKEMISKNKENAACALNKITEEFLSVFEAMGEGYLRERAADLKDVVERVSRKLVGVGGTDFNSIKERSIIVARDLTPSDTAQMDKEKVIGFVTETGGSTSHSAIMARTMEIPAVTGVSNIMGQVENGDLIVMDGTIGEICIRPDKKTLDTYEKRKTKYEETKRKLKTMIGKKTLTHDNHKVEISSNIGTPEDLEGVVLNDGEGIGLFRSEFLYMNRREAPGEEEQYEAYKKAAQTMEGKPVVIRTLDVGGDKEISYLSLPKEMNPFLGYRAIRVCLREVELFKTQLRALLRSSAHGNIKIMFPMISSIEEVRRAKSILKDCKEELRKEGARFDESIEVGIMIEIPAAALISDMLSKEVDFFSIGTNDLIQYTTAVDRMNNTISNLYTPYHPALLRLIKMVIDNGHKEGKWVGMCGESAGDFKLIPIWLGMGLDEFSMSAGSILRARWIINQLSKEMMEKEAEKVLGMLSSEEIESYLHELAIKMGIDKV